MFWGLGDVKSILRRVAKVPFFKKWLINVGPGTN